MVESVRVRQVRRSRMGQALPRAQTSVEMRTWLYLPLHLRREGFIVPLPLAEEFFALVLGEQPHT